MRMSGYFHIMLLILIIISVCIPLYIPVKYKSEGFVTGSANNWGGVPDEQKCESAMANYKNCQDQVVQLNESIDNLTKLKNDGINEANKQCQESIKNTTEDLVQMIESLKVQYKEMLNQKNTFAKLYEDTAAKLANLQRKYDIVKPTILQLTACCDNQTARAIDCNNKIIKYQEENAKFTTENARLTQVNNDQTNQINVLNQTIKSLESR